jgi:acylpyruvate hydrolase
MVVPLDYADVGAVLREGATAGSLRAAAPPRPLSELRLRPPVIEPRKIICIGHNYLAHIQERGNLVPSHPAFFSKFWLTMIGPHDDITLPRASTQVDWEVELVAVIGRRARHVQGAAAEEAIFGYTVMNDTSIRDWQAHTAIPSAGKTFEASTPIGPVVVSRDEVEAGNLRLWTEVDGRRMQDASTSDLLFDPVEIVSYLSEVVTMEPGDLIATGTPAGVGAGRRPPVRLRAGQTVHCGIEGIGELVNICVPEAAG